MNAAARLVGGLGKYDLVTPVLRDTLHWLPIQQRIELKVAVLAFDCVRGTCPSYFCGICTPLTEVGGKVRLCSAHRGDLCVPSTRTEFGKHSFRVAATWNSLPLHLRSPTISRQQFQSLLGSKLISSNAPTYDFYLRELLRSELTYLLTHLLTYNVTVNFKRQSRTLRPANMGTERRCRKSTTWGWAAETRWEIYFHRTIHGKCKSSHLSDQAVCRVGQKTTFKTSSLQSSTVRLAATFRHEEAVASSFLVV